MTLTALVSRYCCYKFDLDDGTKYLYSRSVASFSEWLGRETGHNRKPRPATLRDLTESKICAWLAARAKVIGKHALKRERADLLRLWKWAAGKRWCRAPGDIPAVKLPRKVPRAYSVDQIALCIQVCATMDGVVPGTTIPKRDWWVALLMLIWDTGSRIGAALEITRGQLFLDRCYVVLSDETAKTESEQMLWLRPQTCAILKKLMAHCPGQQTGKVFPLVRSRSTVFAQFRRIRENAGMPRQREGFHKIRSAHATYVTAACGIEAASRQLGHTTTAMTWKSYVDPMILAANQPHAVDVLPALNVPNLAVSVERQGLLF